MSDSSTLAKIQTVFVSAVLYHPKIFIGIPGVMTFAFYGAVMAILRLPMAFSRLTASVRNITFKIFRGASFKNVGAEGGGPVNNSGTIGNNNITINNNPTTNISNGNTTQTDTGVPGGARGGADKEQGRNDGMELFQTHRARNCGGDGGAP